MLKRIKQLHKMWKLSNKDSNYLEVLENITTNDIEKIPDKGNGKAIFISDMNDEEYNQYIRDEKQGWKGFNNKIKQIFK